VEKLLFGCLRLLARHRAGPGRVGLLAAFGNADFLGGNGVLLEWFFGEGALWGKLGCSGGEDRAARVGMGDAIFWGRSAWLLGIGSGARALESDARVFGIGRP